LLALLALVAACGTPKPAEVSAEVGRPSIAVDAEMIPRELVFGNPDKTSPRLSPDGSKLSFLAPVDGVLNVWVGPADDPAAARPVTEDKKRGIRIHFWAYTSKHVVYLQDEEGDEDWHVYVVDLEQGTTRDLTPIEGVKADIVEVSHKRPGEILVGLNDRDPKFHDVHRLDLATGELTLVQENKEFLGFVTDDDFNIRFAMKLTADGGSELFQPGDQPGQWRSFLKIGKEDSETTYPVDFDKSGRVLYMVDSRDRDTSALVSWNLDTDQKQVLAEDPKADLADVFVHPTEKTITAVAFNYDRKRWQILDDAVAPDFEALRQVADGDIEPLGSTLTFDRWMVAYVVDDGPVRYYRYDRDDKQASFLFTNRAALEGKTLARMRPELIESRDGLILVSYLTLPPGTDADGGGRPDRPLPLVLHVHGGPWSRVSWGYNPFHQWFANRGYAVLSVNFRGSTGFGKGFLNAGDLEWAAKMHDDLLDSVEWAVEQGIADPDRVAIFGGSYGGYATLVGMTFTPEVFAAGVDIVGPSNLVTLLESIPPYWAPAIELFAKRVGDHRTEEGRALLSERSPLSRADRIQRPLLIGQGKNDPRVKQAESDQIVDAMKAKGIPVTYVLYPDEGHGFARPENRLSFYAVTEAFLAPILGGRFEPIGDDFEGSSIELVEGAGHVPGLAEALAGGER
jgi:dipeptidyl aminopeptidase/acylaminoacyl peptidase